MTEALRDHGTCQAAARCAAVLHGRLFAALVGGQWNVAPKVHAVVQDADDFDRPFCCYPVYQEVTSTTPRSRNVKRAETRHDLVSGIGPRDSGTFDKFADRLNERIPIDSGLSRAEILSGPFDDIRKIELCESAETNAPSPLGHETSIRMFWK